VAADVHRSSQTGLVRSSTKKPRLRGDQCSNTGNGLSRLVGKEKSLPSATVAEWSGEACQDNATH